MEFVPDARLYITDNGRENATKNVFYRKLLNEGHYIERLDFNYMWRKAFNEKLGKLQDEKYILKVDDDFYFDKPVTFTDFLEKDLKIGLIGGQVWHSHRNEPSDYVFNVERKEGDKYLLSLAKHKGGGYIYCDFVPDFWMARREILPKMPELPPAGGGHEQFFTQIYEMEKDWKVAYTNEVVAIHEKDKQTAEYRSHRKAGWGAYDKNVKLIKP